MSEAARNAQNRSIALAAAALLDVVKEAGEFGAPGGVMYAALIGRLTLQQFEALMDGLVRLGCVKKSGEVYHFVRSIEDAAKAHVQA